MPSGRVQLGGDADTSSQNRRKSELRTHFSSVFTIFASQNATLRSKIADAERAGLPHHRLISWFASKLSISHQPKRLVENRPNATKNRPDATQNRPSATQNRPDTTFSGRSVHDTNSDLRRIACDFLTSDIRVGEAESGFTAPRRLCVAKRGA